jgi:hypothetical protein
MDQKPSLSPQTRRNWLIDAGLFASALLAALSGIYFLFLPVGGYQGGRNPAYGITLLFTRHTWDDLHTWSGVAMIAIAAIHLALHWSWVTNMARRSWKELRGQCGCMNARGRYNLILNLAVALSFLVAALSAIYFLIFPASGRTPDPLFLFSRTTWDILHTWSGVVLIASAVLHLAIHWRWIVKVTRSTLHRALPHHPANPAAPLPSKS